MGDQEDRGAVDAESVEEREDFFGGDRIEVSGRFVGQQEGRIVGEGAGDRDALTFTDGEFAGPVSGAVPHADGVEQVSRLVATFGCPEGGFEHRKLDVLFRVEDRDEVERLEDEPEFVRAEAGGIGPIVEGSVAESDLALGGSIESAQEVEEGRFPAAAGSDEGDVFAGADLEADVVDRHHLSVGEASAERVGFEQGCVFETGVGFGVRVGHR